MESFYDGAGAFFTVLLVLALLACPICTGIVAASKGREPVVWGFLGLIFGPFALLAAVGVPPRDEQAARAHAGKASEKQICPSCDEAVSGAAYVCRYCGNDLPAPDEVPA